MGVGIPAGRGFSSIAPNNGNWRAIYRSGLTFPLTLVGRADEVIE